MNSFTQETWYVSNTGNHQGLIISEDTGYSVAVCYDKKHAKLISAAPKLLEACKEMLATLEQIDFAELPVDYDSLDFRDWESVIRGATGD